MSAFLQRAFGPQLYLTVLAAIVLGAAVGLIWPDAGASLQPLGDVFIAAIQMLIAPVVFCTIVTGIASAGKLASVGRVGIKGLLYFEVMTTLALIIGLIVMNVFHPGTSIHASPDDLKLTGDAKQYVANGEAENWYDFLVGIVPTSAVGAFTDGNVLQVLFLAILFAVALRTVGEAAEPIAHAIERVGDVVMGMVRIVMYLAPIGAFGGMAYATGKFGIDTLTSLGSFVALFWATGVAFMLLAFGLVARLCGVNVLKLYRYFKDELLITLGTANYEAVMPQLMRKLEHAGCPKRIVGLVVPSGYAFNGDGVCLYLGFAALFIAQAFGVDLSLGEQIGLLAVFLITSKGSAGVAGAGFVILAATLSATDAVPVVGIMLILGVDRFLSTMRGLVSLGGQMLGSIVVSRWEGVLDRERLAAALDGRSPAPAMVPAGEPRTGPRLAPRAKEAHGSVA